MVADVGKISRQIYVAEMSAVGATGDAWIQMGHYRASLHVRASSLCAVLVLIPRRQCVCPLARTAALVRGRVPSSRSSVSRGRRRSQFTPTCRLKRYAWGISIFVLFLRLFCPSFAAAHGRPTRRRSSLQGGAGRSTLFGACRPWAPTSGPLQASTRRAPMCVVRFSCVCC